MRGRYGRLAALVLAVGAATGPGAARAATVQVEVAGTDHSVVFEGGAGEANTVTLGVVGPLVDPSTYSVTDATAPLTAGPGCSGGGPAGSTATCQLPASALPCYIRGCPPVAPRNAILEMNLGDGDDALDSAAIPARDGGSGIFSVRAEGGPGADRFSDGPNSATFRPGPGADTVTGGDGYDWAYASDGAPDEPDVYDLGLGRDTVDYGAATYPVAVSLTAGPADDGGAGEGDQVLGTEVAKGGAAADRLSGSDEAPVSELYGADGDDLIEGGSKYDLVEGGPGDDVINGRAGNDQLYGDGITGPAGDDVIRGGVGRDFVEGLGGADRLLGGSGADQVIGSTAVTRDHEVDLVDCGPSRDRLAYIGTEDRVRRCERVRRSSALRAQPSASFSTTLRAVSGSTSVNFR